MHLEIELTELAGNLYKEGRMRDKQRPSTGFFISVPRLMERHTLRCENLGEELCHGAGNGRFYSYLVICQN